MLEYGLFKNPLIWGRIIKFKKNKFWNTDVRNLTPILPFFMPDKTNASFVSLVDILKKNNKKIDYFVIDQ